MSRLNCKGVITWAFHTENLLKTVKGISDYFDDVYIVDFDKPYKLKINKNLPGGKYNPSNGFLLGFFEDIKNERYIHDYTIRQTSLEQIFNKFALEAGKGVETQTNKKEMKMTREILNKV
jgi:hypothetical protein